MAAKRVLAIERTPPANRLLAALPPDVLTRVAPAIDIISLPLKKFPYKTGEPIHEVYSPGEGSAPSSRCSLTAGWSK